MTPDEKQKLKELITVLEDLLIGLNGPMVNLLPIINKAQLAIETAKKDFYDQTHSETIKRPL